MVLMHLANYNRCEREMLSERTPRRATAHEGTGERLSPRTKSQPSSTSQTPQSASWWASCCASMAERALRTKDRKASVPTPPPPYRKPCTPLHPRGHNDEGYY